MYVWCFICLLSVPLYWTSLWNYVIHINTKQDFSQCSSWHYNQVVPPLNSVSYYRLWVFHTLLTSSPTVSDPPLHVLEYNLRQPAERHVKWPFSINNDRTHYYRVGQFVLVVLSAPGLCFGAVARRRPLVQNKTMCGSICHISFHITNKYFQEVREEVIRDGQ